MKAYCDAGQTAWPASNMGSVSLIDKDLKETVPFGVAHHHAGLEISDRSMVEKLFLAGHISVICATSTLAVGVNLPAHLVVLKNTLQYAGGCFEELSDLEVLQMIGRAGRPQFDQTGTAVIMTENKKVVSYENLVSGTEVLESYLHCSLLEHINAEIGLGTIKMVSEAARWLKSTFLYVRIKKNPAYYRIDGKTLSIDQTLEALCQKDLDMLFQKDLVRHSGEEIRISPYGDAMAKYYVRFETMCHILDLPQHAQMKEILIALCKAEEFQALRFRAGEKPLYNELKKHPALKFTYTEKTEEIWHKILMLSQLDICAIDLSGLKEKHRDALNNVSMHKASIRLNLQRFLSCLIDCKLEQRDSITARSGLELKRAVAAKCWENHPGMLRQLKGIGDGSLKTLINAGITSFNILKQTDPRRLEKIFKRNPPFGNHLLADLDTIPQLQMAIDRSQTTVSKDGIALSLQVQLLSKGKPRTKKGGHSHFVIFLADTPEGELLDFRRQAISKLTDGRTFQLQVLLRRYTTKLRFMLCCEEIGMSASFSLMTVGCSIFSEHPLEFPESDFPLPPEPVQTEIQADQETDYMDIFDGGHMPYAS